METLKNYQLLQAIAKLMNKYTINYFISKPPLIINSNIKDVKNPVFLITGLAGSGKTTFGEIISRKNGYKLISLDALKFYDEANLESKKEIDKFISLYPNILPLIKNHWCETDRSHKNDLLYKKYCNIFFDYIVEKYHNSNEVLLIEGIQLFVRIPSQKLQSKTICVLRTSSLECCIRFVRRSNKHISKFTLEQLFTYHIKQKIMLNHFIKKMTND